MRKILLVLTFLVPTVFAQEAAQVVVEAKVYKIDKLDRALGLKELLAGATLEHNPRLLTEYGKETGLRFDYQDDKGSKGSVLEIILQSDQASMTYDIDINLINGGKENISRIDNHPMGQSFIASTIIEDASRVIQIDVSDPQTAVATFLLQVSSNLGCDSLAIALNSQGDEQSHYLEFTTKAFASVPLPKGEFSFGNVICRTGEEFQTFDILQDQLMPLVVGPGQTYYGGRLIFKQVEQVDANQTPTALENCLHPISRARGEKQDNLCDGAGSEAAPQATTRIEVYMPDETEEDIAAVKQAFSASGDPLLYLPLKIKE